MTKQVTNFGFLGKEFQLKLVSQIMSDRTFGLNIINLISPSYFDNQYCKQIVTIIKDYNEKTSNQLPTISGLQERIMADCNDPIQRQGCIAVVQDIHKRALEDDEQTKELAHNFCSQQELVKAIKKAEKIIANGAFETFHEIEGIFRNALSMTEKKDDSMEVNDDLDDALEEDYRKAFPTGISGLDDEIGGGLAKQEVGMLIIPTGVGKTTLLSKFANTTYERGGNVLQIFFEDKKKDIQRKHLTALTGIPLNDLSKSKDYVKSVALKAKENGGRLILKKCPSDSTTIPHIKQYLRYLLAKGIKIDMLILDYIDCVIASKITEDGNANEGTVMRQLESLTSEFDIATWTAAQGNRSSISADVVSTDQIQGSIKRAQVGHIIISVAKTLEQKASGLATMAILKSRIGGDGNVFQNMKFDNASLIFDTKECDLVTTMAFEESKKDELESQKDERAMKALKRFQESRKVEQENKEKNG